MKITFVSNYINHHQLPFCKAMSEYGQGVEFFFVQVMPMEEKRRQMGWEVDATAFPYVVLYYEEEERAKELILNSDIVLFGWTEDLIYELEQERLSSGKISFRVSERIYREGQWKFISPKGLLKKYHEHYKFRNLPVYLLCTGAYVASDFEIIRSYRGKRLKWGYFPDASCDDSEIVKSTGNRLKLCWAGRLIELKHPEFAVMLAKDLLEKGYEFDLEIVGDGPLKDKLDAMIKESGLEGCVTLTGSKKPAEVLSYMRRTDIFLFTSNYLEGWGAVVNEAMESGCAVVASYEAGSVPFLIVNGENGLVYHDGQYEEFRDKVKFLFENRNAIDEFGKRARDTIRDTWNAKTAAERFIVFAGGLLEGKTPLMASDGPMSPAEVLKAPGLHRTIREKNRLE